jgi:glycosyltransferase involved in cell wall biosynthesis
VGASVDSEVIVFVGHLQPRKGLDILIDAFERIQNRADGPLLFIVGGVVDPSDELYRAGLSETVRRLGIDARVRFCGSHDDVRPFLLAADLFCLPSHREGMPNAMLEAMACGVACIAPTSAGAEELLADGAGLVLASNTPVALAEEINRLLDEPLERARLSKAAVQRVTSRNDPARIAESYLDALLSPRRA